MTHTIVASAAQRAAVLRNIERSEARMLPPGWDAGIEHQFGATLTDPRGQAPLLIDVAEADPDPEPCAPGLCDQHNTACAGRCRYQLADVSLGEQREPMPATNNTQTRALAKWLLIVGIAIGAALIWAGSR